MATNLSRIHFIGKTSIVGDGAIGLNNHPAGTVQSIARGALLA